MTKIHYSRLTSVARLAIQDYGITVAEYVRKAGWADGDWHGDRCGCTDDRCIGYHHAADEECGCLPMLVEQALGWTYPDFHLASEGYPAVANGGCLGLIYRSSDPHWCRQCGWYPTTTTPVSSRGSEKERDA